MNSLHDFFWNDQERRPRALWRLLLQAVVLVIGLLVTQSLAGILLVASRAGDAAFLRAISNPATATSAMLEAVNNTWWFVPLNGFATLLVIAGSLWLAAAVWDRRPYRDFGFHFDARWWRDFAFGLALGALLMALIFTAELAVGWITISGTFQARATGQSFAFAVSLALLEFIFVGIREEMLSRGYQLRNLAEGLNWRWWTPEVALLLGWFLSSAVFGALHAANPNATVVSTLNLILAGLFLGLGYVLTGELAIPIGLHIAWNFFQGDVFGFPVSGTTVPATFVAIKQGGPDLWTGGAFGPEAGLLGLLAAALGSLLIWFWVRGTKGRAPLQARLAQYLPRGSEPPPYVEASQAGVEGELT